MSSTPKRDRLFGVIAELLDGRKGALLHVTLIGPLGSWQWSTIYRSPNAPYASNVTPVGRFGWALTLLAKALRWTPHGELRARGSGA